MFGKYNGFLSKAVVSAGLSQSLFWNTDFSSLLRAFFDRPVLWSEVGRGVIGDVSLF
jgi:hypothetical protein